MAPQVAPPAEQVLEPESAELDSDADDMVWGLDPGSIREALRTNMPKIRECYAGWVKSNPELRGRLKVTFTIAAPDDAEFAGIEAALVADSELDHALMEGCVLNVVGDLHFERPDKPITVRYPLVFDTD